MGERVGGLWMHQSASGKILFKLKNQFSLQNVQNMHQTSGHQSKMNKLKLQQSERVGPFDGLKIAELEMGGKFICEALNRDEHKEVLVRI